MTEQVVIEFISDSSKLQPGIDELHEFTAIDKELAAEFSKTNDAMKQRAKIIEASSASVDKHADSLQKVGKASAGALGTKVFSDYEKAGVEAAKKVTAQLDALIKKQVALDKENKDLSATSQSYRKELEAQRAQLIKLTAELAALQKATDDTGTSNEKAEKKVVSFKAQLRAMQQELTTLADSGEKFSTKYNMSFDELAKAAGELKDNIGDISDTVAGLSSDTKGMDGFIQGLSTGAAAAQAFAGAEALFGAESEDLQKTLVKLNAVMAIAAGIREVTANLQKGQILRTQLEAASQSVLGASTKATTFIFKLFNVEVEAGSQVFKNLRGAIIATGLGVLLVLIGFIATAISNWKSETQKLTEAQVLLNHQLEAELQFYKELTETVIANTEKHIKALQQELFVLKLKQASQEDILKKEQEIAIAEETRATLAYNSNLKFINGLEQTNQELEKQRISLKLLKDELEAKGGKDEDLQKVDSIQGSIDKLEEKRDVAIKYDKEYQEAKNALAQKNAEREEFYRQTLLKSAITNANDRLILAKTGSAEELKYKKQSIDAQVALDLHNAYINRATDEAYYEEKKSIFDKANKEKQLATQAFNLYQLDTQKEANEALLASADEGSEAQLTLRLKQIEIEGQYAIESIGNVKDAETRKNKIREDALAKAVELVKQYNYQIAQSAINTSLSNVKAEMAALEIQADANTNEQLLKLKESALDKQANLERLSANNTITDAEERAARIKEIDAKLAADKLSIERQLLSAQMDIEKQYNDTLLEGEIAALDATRSNENSSNAARALANKQYFEKRQQALDESMADTIARYEAGLISEDELLQKALEYHNKTEELKTEKTKEEETKRREIREQIIQASFQAIQAIADTFFEMDQQRRQTDLDAQLSALDAKKQKEIDNKNLTDQQKADAEARYDQKAKQIKRAAAIRERDAQIKAAEINGFLAVTNALATVHPFFPAAILAAGSAALLAGLQVAKIKQTALPQLWRGTRDATEGMYRVAELGKEMMYHPSIGLELMGMRGEETRYIPQGATVFNAADTSRLLQEMPSMNIDYPQMNELPDWALQHIGVTVQNSAPEIDYDKMGRSIAKHMPDKPQFSINWDEAGASLHFIKKNKRVEILNKRYTTKF